MDLMPTLLEAVGKPVPANLELDGVSLLGQLRGKSKEQPHKFMFHHCGTDIFAMRWIKTNGQVLKLLLFNLPPISFAELYFVGFEANSERAGLQSGA